MKNFVTFTTRENHVVVINPRYIVSINESPTNKGVSVIFVDQGVSGATYSVDGQPDYIRSLLEAQ